MKLSNKKKTVLSIKRFEVARFLNTDKIIGGQNASRPPASSRVCRIEV